MRCVWWGRLEYENRFCFFGQAYAGFFFIARALLFNGTSEIDDFNKSVVEFCQTPWKVVSFRRNVAIQGNFENGRQVEQQQNMGTSPNPCIYGVLKIVWSYSIHQRLKSW